ncbi:phage tail tape measure protein, partial [Klebsiella pneumoniae]
MAQVAATFTANISGYTNSMQAMTRSTQGMQSGVGSLASKVSSGMSSIGKVTMAAGAATTAMGVSSLRSYGTFQQSLNKAAVVAGGTSKDIGQLADMANKMGAELPLSAQDAADAMVSMAQDGASIKTITKEFPAIAQAATATGADLQTTAGTVQQAMNVWGDSL